MKVLILYDHIREEHFSVSNDGSVKNVLLNTPNGRVLKQLLSNISGINRGRSTKDYDIEFLYPMVPTPIKNNYGKTIKYQDIKLSEVKPYYERMNQIIIDNKYDIIIPLGKLGVKYLLNVSAIGKVRGVPNKVTITSEDKKHDVWVLPTYSIEYTNVNKNSERHVVADLKLLGKFVEQGEDVFKPKEVKYELVTNIERVREIFNKEVKNDNHDGVDITAWDLETNSLSPDREGSKPLVLSMSWKNGQGVTIPLYKSDFTWENGQQDIDEILSLLKEWVASKEDIKVGHNLKYDMNFLMATQGFKDFENNQDTLVGWYLAVTQDTKDSKRLSDLAYEVTDVGGYDKPLEDFKEWYVLKLLRFLSDKLKEIKKENKKVAKKEYNIKANDYDTWLNNKLYSIDIELTDEDKHYGITVEQKRYLELKLTPEVVTKTMLMESEFKAVVESSPEYMSLSNEAKDYVLDIAVNLINTYKDNTKVINEVDGGNFNYDWIPLELMHPYASGDTDVCRRVYCNVIEILKEQNRPKAIKLLTEDYPRLNRTLARIESNGLYADLDYMSINDDAYYKELIDIEDKIRSHWTVKEFEEERYSLYQLSLVEHEKKPSERDKSIHEYRAKFKNDGWKFNPGSGEHLANILYRILGFYLPYDQNYIKSTPYEKKKENEITWKDYKTDIKSLTYIKDNLKTTDDIEGLLDLLLYYASIKTKRSSFTKKLPAMVNKKTKTLHGSFSATTTATSRLASSNPNLQNLVSHTSNVNTFDYHHPIKRSFVSRFHKGVILQADYSALELRVTGLMTGDKEMTKVFIEGGDLHKNTASLVYNKPEEEITTDERKKAKTVSFSLLYGDVPFSFASKNNMPIEEAEELFNNYYKHKPAVGNAIKETHEFVEKHGYVETLHGFRRFIGNAKSKDKSKRNEALRQSFNAKVQGLGSWFTSMAITYIDDFIQSRDMKSKLVATVHDSIVVDAHPDEVQIMAKVVLHCMENLPFDFLTTEYEGEIIRYPITADMEIGTSYGDLVEYDENEITKFTSPIGYIKYKLALQQIRDYYESGKLTEEQYKQKTEYIKNNIDSFKVI
ncbi:DNA polymerase I [Staphylococcus phage vB_SauM_VL10]|nr:DNA polymerase I [Staphylococcus phage vB_SauM_VL10]